MAVFGSHLSGNLGLFLFCDRDRRLQLEVQHGLTADNRCIPSGGQNDARASTRTGGCADSRALLPADNGPDDGANSGADADFRGVIFLGGIRLHGKSVRGDLNRLAVRRVQLRELDGKPSDALHSSAFIGLNDPSFDR